MPALSPEKAKILIASREYLKNINKRNDFNKIKRQQIRLFLWRNQKGICPFCKQSIILEEGVVDHDHLTNKIRALIHKPCNKIIGSHTIESARQIINFLEQCQTDLKY